MKAKISGMLRRAAAVAIAVLLAPAYAQPEGKTILFIPEADLRSLDPIWTTASITRNHGYMVYDTLFALDEHFQPQPQMVDTWKISDDKLTYTFTLRDKLKFHDGQPVRSADCIASLERWMKRDTLGQALAAAVSEMKAENDRTFSIILKKPLALLYIVDQQDIMTALAGDEKNWKRCFSYYACGTPMASEAGAEPLKGKGHTFEACLVSQ
jgi:peptide/nickel transport system substrate-binding protein